MPSKPGQAARSISNFNCPLPTPFPNHPHHHHPTAGHAPYRPGNNVLSTHQGHRRSGAGHPLKTLHIRAAPGADQTDSPLPNRAPRPPGPARRRLRRALPRSRREPRLHDGHHPPSDHRPPNRLRGSLSARRRRQQHKDTTENQAPRRRELQEAKRWRRRGCVERGRGTSHAHCFPRLFPILLSTLPSH